METDPVWELYHENSKNGRRLGVDDPRPPAGHQAAGFHARGPLVPLGSPLPQEAGGATPLVSARAFTRTALSRLLTVDAAADSDLVLLAVHAPAVIDLTAGLYLYDRSAHGLALEKARDLSSRLGPAIRPDGLPSASPVQIILAAELALAAGRYGERGYRRALMATGAWSHAIGLTAAGMGLAVAHLDFYDRDVDGIVGLDGISRGVMAVLAVVAGERG